MSEVTQCCPMAGKGSRLVSATDIGESEITSITKTPVPACKIQNAPDTTTAAIQKAATDGGNHEEPGRVLETEKSAHDVTEDACTIANSKVDNAVSIANQNLSDPGKPIAESENSPATSNVNGKSDASNAMENTNKKNEMNIKQTVTISKLEQEIQKRTQERDGYRKKLQETEKKMAALQTSYNSLMCGDNDETTLRQTVEQLKSKLIQTSLQLEERGRVVANQENQINALNNQVTSLKEVVAITRNLLQVRNMQVKHLQAEVDDMENRISEERTRHNTMLNKMEAAVRLNADLKKEYETQLRLFQDLRGKYEEKVTLLSEEKQALEAAAQPVAQ